MRRAIVNNTHYFNPLRSKVYNTFVDPKSQYYADSKTMEYETRLYFEWKRTEALGGLCFFYTLTYNDKSCPKYFGRNCLDYEDIRSLLNGAFYKKLYRAGFNLKYFVSSELGDGKGSRGFRNNPHYHCLFFVTPRGNRILNPFHFRCILKRYWQGFDEITDGYHSYKLTGKGIVREGKYGAVVTSSQAVTYAAKYVVKDTTCEALESDIATRLYKPLYDHMLYDLSIFLDYKGESRDRLPEMLPGHQFTRDIFDAWLASDTSNDYRAYVQRRVSEVIKAEIQLFRNRFSNKVRISNGVGLSALDTIVDKLDPKLEMDFANGHQSRNLGLYYYRKLYNDVVKDDKGNPIYVLNELGQRMKNKHLPDLIYKTVCKAESALLYANQCPDFDIERQSLLLKVDKDVLSKYAIYKNIYEYRLFKHNHNQQYPVIAPCDDFANFLAPTLFDTSFSEIGAQIYQDPYSKGYRYYLEHPYFAPYIRLFDSIDRVVDYMDNQRDKERKQRAEERKRIRQVHNSLKI